MKFLVYVLVYPILWLVSILPFPVFYLLSDAIYLLVYYAVRYRRTTVKENLALTLPERTPAERKTIEKEFYHYMCDMFLEMVKTLSISEKEIKKRYVFTNIDLILEMEKQNKSIVLFCAHYASWEWMIVLGRYINYKGFGIYKKIANPHFDGLMHRIRSRFDAQLIDTRATIKVVRENEAQGIKGIYAFISDQTPTLGKANYWQEFMNIEVPIHTGGEALAKKLDLNVLYLKVDRVKRGYYRATFVPLAENITEIPNYEVTNRFIKEVEKQIYEKPQYYFWTHKRWKLRGRNPKKAVNNQAL